MTENRKAKKISSSNPQRFDPYKNFKFRVKWDSRVVAGVSRISALRRSTEVVEYREGGDPSTSRHLPGRTSYEPITLERGITYDSAFEAWANSVAQLPQAAGKQAALAAIRKDIIIEVCNEAGHVILAYKVHGCWVSVYQALPDLDANISATVIEAITLQHEGWARDTSVPKPAKRKKT